MAFVDPERFKRFEKFLAQYLPFIAEAAHRGFTKSGPGVLIYRAPDDRFDTPLTVVKFEYKTRADIEAAQAEARDELIQGMLERYGPPNEALAVAIYPDNSYDVSRLDLRTVRPQPTRPN